MPNNEDASMSRNGARIMIAGDSVDLGWNSQIGGYRPGLSAGLTAARVTHSFVGPLSDAYGAHRAVIGTAAADQTSQLQTDCVTYRPNVVIIGWLVNDIGGVAAGGKGHTPAQAVNDVGVCVDWVKAAGVSFVFVRTAVVPQTNDIQAYYDRRTEVAEGNSLLPSMITSRGGASAGIHIFDAGTPTTSDGVHPDQQVAGYNSMATRAVNTFLLHLPGA